MKAVVSTGSKQYLVEKGDQILVERLKSDKKNISLDTLAVVDGKNSIIGRPGVEGVVVTAKVLDHVRDKKVTAIRFKAKKRVNKKRGHRQLKTKIEITSIKIQ